MWRSARRLLFGWLVRVHAPRQRRTDATKRLGELARDHEHLVRIAFRELRQHLQVFVAQQLTIWFTRVDRFEDGVDRLRFALGTQDRGLTLALGIEDRRLLSSFGVQDSRLLGALSRRSEERRVGKEC